MLTVIAKPSAILKLNLLDKLSNSPKEAFLPPTKCLLP